MGSNLSAEEIEEAKENFEEKVTNKIKNYEVHLVGSVDSGKRTLYHQKILKNDTLLWEYKYSILNSLYKMTSKYQNLIQTNIISERDMENISFEQQETQKKWKEQKKREKLRDLTKNLNVNVDQFSAPYFEKIYLQIIQFWNIEQVREYYHELYWKGKYNISDNYQYFLTNIERFTPDYEVYLEDAIKCHLKLNDLCHVLDIDEKNKIKILLNPSMNSSVEHLADMLVFVTNLTNYFKQGFECDLELFERTIEVYTKKKKDIPVILVLTMSDKFQESLMYHDFQFIFEDYNYENTPTEFIKDKFLNIYKQNVTVFVTCGFDFERNNLLYELIDEIRQGYTVDNYYAYKGFLTIPKIGMKDYNLTFKFK
eukprot:gene7114-11277_t